MTMIIFSSVQYSVVFYLYLAAGLTVFILLFFVTAPYGRHTREGWGPKIDKRAGWIIMEVISPLAFVLFFIQGDWKRGFFAFFFLFLWLFHYIYRTFIFSSLQKGTNRMPLAVVFFAMLFNVANGYLQSSYLYSFSPGPEKYNLSWLTTPQFLIGVVLFFLGFSLHVHSDTITRKLRVENEYGIPRGGGFRWVTAPNYLGEIIEWTGWALLTWSIAGAAFAFWTAANLVPRAVAHHKWYNRTFPDYPEDRKAIIPYIF